MHFWATKFHCIKSNAVKSFLGNIFFYSISQHLTNFDKLQKFALQCNKINLQNLIKERFLRLGVYQVTNLDGKRLLNVINVVKRSVGEC